MNERPTGITILAAFDIVAIIFAGIGILLVAPLTTGSSELDSLLLSYKLSVLAVIGFSGLVSAVRAWALWTLQPWGRLLLIVTAIIELIAFPLGTVIGIIILWYVWQPHVKAAFAGGPIPLGGGPRPQRGAAFAPEPVPQASLPQPPQGRPPAESRPVLGAWLIDERTGQNYQLTAGNTRLGRADLNEIYLDDAAVFARTCTAARRGWAVYAVRPGLTLRHFRERHPRGRSDRAQARRRYPPGRYLFAPRLPGLNIEHRLENIDVASQFVARKSRSAPDNPGGRHGAACGSPGRSRVPGGPRRARPAAGHGHAGTHRRRRPGAYQGAGRCGVRCDHYAHSRTHRHDAAVATPSPTPELGTSNVYVEYIVDASGSMTGTLPFTTTTKLAVAKDLLKTHLDAFRPETNIGLRAYGHRVDYRVDEAKSCQDIELIAPPRPGNLETIATWLKAFRAQGMTPLAASLQQALNDFTFDACPQQLDRHAL